MRSGSVVDNDERSSSSMPRQDADKEGRLAHAFRHRTDYFEMMRAHNLRVGFDVNIEEEVKQMVIKNMKGNVLDAGCGEGSIAAWMATNNPNAAIYGIDISLIGIKMARELCEKNGLENTSFLVGDLRSMPFRKEFFNLILCQSVLEHVFGVRRVLAEFRRVLRTKGKIAVRVGNGESGLQFSLIGWARGGSGERELEPSLQLRKDSFEDHRENFNACSISSYVLTRMLRKLGFTIEFHTTYPCGFLRSAHGLDFAIRKILWVVRRHPPISHMGPTTIILANKP